MASEYDFRLKLMLVGNSAVGKTAIIDRYAREEDFKENSVHISGVNFTIQYLTLDNMRIMVGAN